MGRKKKVVETNIEKVELKQKDRYLRNPNLPVLGASFDFTPEMVKELKKCSDNIIHFAENYFYIVNLDEGLMKIPLHKYQKRILRAYRDNRFNIVLASRQCGKTTITTIYTLWKCCFTNYYRVLIVANKESTAKGIFNRIKKAYEELPVWLKPGVKEYAQTSMVLANGSSIGISTTSSDAGRGDSCNCSIGQTLITIKNKETGEIINCTFSDFYELIKHNDEYLLFVFDDVDNYKVISNKNYSILTPTGFRDFKGLIVGENKNKIKLTFDNGKTLICTPKHKLVLSDIFHVYAEELSIGDILPNNLKLLSKEFIQNDELVYDIYNVENHIYLIDNQIVTHNCLAIDEASFIREELLDPFWKSVYPIISSSKKAQILICSTPNGTGNLFHKLWSGAIAGTNGWFPSRIDWEEIPGRDLAWKQETIRNLGSEEIFNQEFGNEFLKTGESSLDEQVHAKLLANCRDPEFILEDGCYKVWDEPVKDRIYVAGVDISEGVGKNSSVINILDITDLSHIKQVAIYSNNKIIPFDFAKKVNDVLDNWGKPPALIERNNCGITVIDQLVQTYNYPLIVTYQHDKKEDLQRQGINSHTNSKYSGVVNMRYWVNSKCVVDLRDKDTVSELKNFVRKDNGTWSGQNEADLDDRVMSLIWALFILDKKIIERYFEVLKEDDNGKPLLIKPINWEPNIKNNPFGMYRVENKPVSQDTDYSTLPVFIGNNREYFRNEMDWLKKEGYKPVLELSY